MGLDIRTKNKKYSHSYSGIHAVRTLACVMMGYPKGQAMNREDGKFSWAEVAAHAVYPNLMLHSDSDGQYTMKGRVSEDSDGPNGESELLTGSLPGLVDELRRFKLEASGYEGGFPYAFQVLKDLTACAKDALKHKQPLKFQ